jgi:chemotaxis protein MotB
MEKKPQVEEAPPSSVGDWIVTFSDCMTLLLCFFVLLLTFSSFEEIELGQFTGSFKSASHTSIFSTKREVKDSVVPPAERPADHTVAGSEKPTEAEIKSTRRTRKPLYVVSSDAFSNRKTFHIPSGELFWANGTGLKRRGRKRLEMIADLIRKVPCEVVISESSSVPAGARGDRAAEKGIDRASTLAEFFAARAQVPPGRFSVAAYTSTPIKRFAGEPVIEIELSAGVAYE